MIQNISFKSAILVRGRQDQIKKITDRMWDESIETVDTPRIEVFNLDIPEKELTSAAEATFKMHIGGVNQFQLPIQSFPFSVVQLQQGVNDSDSIYMLATDDDAAAVDVFENFRESVVKSLKANETAISSTRDRLERDKLIDINIILRENFEKAKGASALLLETYNHTLTDAGKMLSAIGRKCFNFQTLEFLKNRNLQIK